MRPLELIQRIQSKTTRRFIIAGAVVLFTGFGLHTYQAWHLNRSVDSLLSEQRYEEAIELLRKNNSPYLNPEGSQRLARLLTTNPKLSARNYSEAIGLSTKIIDFSFSTVTRQAAIDTLVCARFANREEKTAIELAEKNGLKNRVDQFSVGRPCNDFPAFRSIASEENKKGAFEQHSKAP